MRMKSYFAGSVQEAMAKARVELGPDAMLISSRQTGRDLKDLGAYEVVFGLEHNDADAPASTAGLVGLTEPRNSAQDQVARELAELRRQLETLGESVARTATTRAVEDFTPELSRHFDRLVHTGFSPELAQELVQAAAQRTRTSVDGLYRPLREHADPFTRDLFSAILYGEIESRLSVAPSLGDDANPSAAVLFVGPAGAGKTTSLVKLGLHHGVKARRQLHFLSLDTLRVGGCDLLGKYARLSGAEFRPLNGPASLASALDRYATTGLVLIDTPGFSPAETEEAEEMARAVRQSSVEVQLVLPANLTVAAAGKIAKRFAAFGPAKLLLTHLDETPNPAAVSVELSLRLGLPLSFLSTGQQIPEDISAAEKTTLMEPFAIRERAAVVAA